jgi:hypothetical protein
MMNQQDIFKKIGLILNELQDQYEFLAQNPSQLNELELELFLANANFLSDHVQIVRKINNNPPVKQIPEHAEVAEVDTQIQPLTVFSAESQPVEVPVAVEVVEKAVELPVQSTVMVEERAAESELVEEVAEPEEREVFRLEPEHENQFQDELFKLEQEPAKFEFILNEGPLSDKFDFEDKSIDDIFDRPLSKEEERIIAEKQNLVSAEPIQQTIPEVVMEEIPVHVESAKNAVETGPEIEQTTFESLAVEVKAAVSPVIEESPRLTLNDLLAGKNNNTANVNDGSFKTPITDLRQAINLNEKLLYIKDLFNGYNLAYAEAIDLINKMPDFQAADKFLQHNYAIKNNWASKQTTVDQFYELLNQRFPAR